MARTRGTMVTGYAQMWPRAVFDMKEKGELLKEPKDALEPAGVYVLRDEIEAVLIAAMPTANSANPKIHPIQIPTKVTRVLAKRSEIDTDYPDLHSELARWDRMNKKKKKAKTRR